MGALMAKNGNLLESLPSQATMHVVMLGLDSAGKTTALYRLKFDQYLNTVPTIGFNCEKIQGTIGKARGVHFLVWDVGGQEKLRPLWRSYTRCTDGILFVVDSVDTERMEEAKMELMRTTKCPGNQGVPVLILANKQDLPNAHTPKELEKLLGLQELRTSTANTLSPILYSSSTSATRNFGGHLNKHTPIIVSNIGTSSVSKLFPADSETEQSAGKQLNSSKNCITSHIVDDDSMSCLSPSTSSIIVRNSQFAIMCNCLIPSTSSMQVKGWYIQPACAITGEGLQEGLDALFNMILKRRKINKSCKKKNGNIIF